MQKQWFNDLGFQENPLRMTPHERGFKKIDEMLPFIMRGGIVYLQGRYGTGKTSTLRTLIKRLKGKHRIVYFSCHQQKPDFEDLLYTNFLRRLLKIKAKGLIALIDEIQEITDNEAQEIIDLYKRKYIRSVVLASNADILDIPESLQQLIGTNVVVTGSLTLDEAWHLIKERLGENELLTRDRVEKIYKRSSNPREFLQNVEDYCRRVYDTTQAA